MILSPVLSSPTFHPGVPDALVSFAGHNVPLAVHPATPLARFQATSFDDTDAVRNDALAAARQLSKGDPGAVAVFQSFAVGVPNPLPTYSVYPLVNVEDGPMHGQPFRFEGTSGASAPFLLSSPINADLLEIVDGDSTNTVPVDPG